ncbi:glycosyltransferase family 4 protein [bacterium]|nr:glycosyltransferase family 4 protein [bacterium]
MKLFYGHYLGRITSVSVGPFVHIQEFSRAMEKRGHRVFVFPQLDMSGARIAARSRVRLLSKYTKQFKNILQNAASFFREMRQVQSCRPDILIVRYSLFRFSILAVSRLKRIPLIFEVNTPMAHEIRALKKEFFYFPVLPQMFEKTCFKMADALVVVSEELKKYICRMGIPAGRVHAVPNGVDIGRMHPRAGQSRRPLPFSAGKGRVIVGFVGSFNYWHSIRSIYDPMKRILRRFRSVQFVLLGDGFTRPELERRIREDGFQERIRMPGFVAPEDIPACLSKMDILLAPYPVLDFFYFSPLKIFEYMAASKPVLATRIGQIAEIIQDGVSGCLYGDEAEFVQKLSRLIRDRKARTRMGKAARKRVAEKFTWDRNAARIEDVCNALGKGNGE